MLKENRSLTMILRDLNIEKDMCFGGNEIPGVSTKFSFFLCNVYYDDYERNRGKIDGIIKTKHKHSVPYAIICQNCIVPITATSPFVV